MTIRRHGRSLYIVPPSDDLHSMLRAWDRHRRLAEVGKAVALVAALALACWGFWVLVDENDAAAWSLEGGR